MTKAELWAYEDEIIKCANFYKDRDYVLYLIFKDEAERVEGILREMHKAWVDEFVRERSKRWRA